MNELEKANFNLKNLLTISKLAKKYEFLTEPILRNIIYLSKNGDSSYDECIYHCGDRILIHEDMFLKCRENKIKKLGN